MFNPPSWHNIYVWVFCLSTRTQNASLFLTYDRMQVFVLPLQLQISRV